MKINYIKEKEILDFEKEIGYELEANERSISANSNAILKRFYVNFPKGEVMEGNSLIGCSGNGDTIDEALKEFCKLISNKTIAFNAFSKERKNIQIPKLVHTKLLGQ